MDPLAQSPFRLLEDRESLGLVTDIVHEDDALCLALTCRRLRDELWARFAPRPAADEHAGKRLRTRDAAVVVSMSRVTWVRGMGRSRRPKFKHRPSWLPAAGRRIPEASAVLICLLAAEHGSLSVLEWARAIDCSAQGAPVAHAPLRFLIPARAAARGHVAVLRYWKRTGGVWDEMTTAAAAGGGHLETLQWLRVNGCPWDEQTCATAAGGGHLDVLQVRRRQVGPEVGPTSALLY
jgi:hypothetical protein